MHRAKLAIPAALDKKRVRTNLTRILALFAASIIQPHGQSEPPTFYKDVLPILEGHCQGCHRPGEIAPMPLLSYTQVRPWANAIRQQVKTRHMPPWFAAQGIGTFSNDPSLSESQIQTISSWVDSGCPQGRHTDAPPPRKWTEGWNISPPTSVIEMPKPVSIPATGDVEYTYEIVPTHFTKDTWVHLAEIRPSSRQHVHHAVVYVRPPQSAWLGHAPIGVPFTASTLSDPQAKRDAMWTDSDVLLVYAPGSSPDNWPAGMAKLIPAGSDLVFQIHYTTNGKPGSDQTAIGLVTTNETPAQRVMTLQLTNDRFIIPPGVDNYRVEARGTMPNNALLLSFFPHMHLRGKRFEYNIVRSDGAIEPLLNVKYNFYWQLSYRLAVPIPLKAGTTLEAVAWFDNSKNNPHNPDPDSAVHWGDQTYDEMMVGFFDVAVAPGIDKYQFFQRPHAQ